MRCLGKGRGPQGTDHWTTPSTSPEPGPDPALCQVLGGVRGGLGQFSFIAKCSAGGDTTGFLPTTLEGGPINSPI